MADGRIGSPIHQDYKLSALDSYYPGKLWENNESRRISAVEMSPLNTYTYNRLSSTIPLGRAEKRFKAWQREFVNPTFGSSVASRSSPFVILRRLPKGVSRWHRRLLQSMRVYCNPVCTDVGVCLRVCPCLSVCLLACLLVCLPACPSVYLDLCMHIYTLFAHLFIIPLSLQPAWRNHTPTQPSSFFSPTSTHEHTPTYTSSTDSHNTSTTDSHTSSSSIDTPSPLESPNRSIVNKT